MRIKIFTIVALFIGIVMLSLTSCTSDEEPVSTQSNSDTQRAKVSFQVSTSSYDVTRADDTEEGDHQVENCIQSDNYRVYFYDTDNYYIAELENAVCTEINPGEYDGKYTITGDVPDELKPYTDFKVVVIANWIECMLYYTDVTSFDYPTPEPNSTIDDLCTPTESFGRFDVGHLNSKYTDGLGPNFWYFMPFYGVHEYTEVSFEKGSTTTLEGIDLLRAAARVELTYEPDTREQAFSGSAVMCFFDYYGSCGPSGVYSQFDYSTRGLNMVNSEEMNGASVVSGSGIYTLYAYLPEFDNKNANKETCFKLIYFPYYWQMNEYGYAPIYFAEYDDNGKTTAYNDESEENIAKRWDVVRNTIYKFEVTMGEDLKSANAIDPSIKKSSNTPNIKVKSERIELK